jgi:periplasmic protein TonB
MKKLLLYICLSLSSISFGQSDSIYNQPDQAAEFPGGEGELMRLLMDSLKFNAPNTDEITSSLFLCTVLIEKDGAVGEIIVLKGINNEIDKSILAIFKCLPKFKPAVHNGERVNSYFTFPIRICFN